MSITQYKLFIMIIINTIQVGLCSMQRYLFHDANNFLRTKLDWETGHKILKLQ